MGQSCESAGTRMMPDPLCKPSALRNCDDDLVGECRRCDICAYSIYRADRLLGDGGVGWRNGGDLG